MPLVIETIEVSRYFCIRLSIEVLALVKLGTFALLEHGVSICHSQASSRKQ
jgi:hypothetical protein